MNKKTAEENLNRAKELEENNDFFSASFYYKEALGLFLKQGDKKNIKLCKNKIVQMNKEFITFGEDLKEIAVEHEFRDEEIEKLASFINEVVNEGSIDRIFKNIGNNSSLTPNFKDIVTMSNRTMPVSYHFASLLSVSDQGHLLRGGEDSERQWVMEMYDMLQQHILDLYLLPIFRKIMLNSDKKIKFDFENLFQYFEKSDLIKQNNLGIIQSGLKAFFDEDYTSVLHILIPQFESVFLNLSELCGVDIIALDQKLGIATRTKTLSDKYLSSEEFINVWGQNFCEQIKFALFEPLGYRLRHRVAHGEILKEECNFRNSSLIIYFFLVMLGGIKKIDD